MTTLEILLSVLCPVALVGWTLSYWAGRTWRTVADHWRQTAINGAVNSVNTRRQHPLQRCIVRASIRRANLPGKHSRP